MIRRNGPRQTRNVSANGRGSRITNVGFVETEIQRRRVADLVLDPRNPRQHSPKQVLQIADRIREFGFITPVVIDDKGNVVIGHGRVLAAKQLRMTEVPVIELRHLSQAQLKAFRLADNQIALGAHWDERLLGEQFVELKSLDLDFDIEITGFSAPEIDLTIQNMDQSSVPDEEQGSVTGAPVCQAGDLWMLDAHRILCGDATLRESFEQLMQTDLAQLVFVDPPYNVRINGPVSGKGKTRHREFAQASGELSSREFTNFLTVCCKLLADFSIDGSIHFVCMDWRHSDELLAAGGRAYSELKNINVWVKSDAGLGSLYRSQHEFVFVFKSGAAPHINNIALGKHGRHRTNVWSYPSAGTLARKGDDLLALHPTAKPVNMIVDAILDCSARGGIVLDTFLGSGTTLLACERAGRVCRAMELDPLYIDTAIRRWQNLTGSEARRASDGKLFRQIESEQESANGVRE